jgi:hypothetical protein
MLVKTNFFGVQELVVELEVVAEQVEVEEEQHRNYLKQIFQQNTDNYYLIKIDQQLYIGKFN